MNRIDRLNAILIHLQGKPPMSLLIGLAFISVRSIGIFGPWRRLGFR